MGGSSPVTDPPGPPEKGRKAGCQGEEERTGPQKPPGEKVSASLNHLPRIFLPRGPPGWEGVESWVSGHARGPGVK